MLKAYGEFFIGEVDLAELKQNPVILQVIPQLATGGAELSTLEMVDAICSVGGEALVVTEGGRMEDRLKALGGEIVTMSVATKNPLQIFRNKQELEGLIVKRNVALVHARSRAPAWSSLLASTKINIPFVTTYHGAYGEMEPFKRLYNSVMARGDIVIANSRFTADLVQARHGTPDERLRVIYRGVDVKRFSRQKVSDERVQALRKQWGIAEDRLIILHPARLTRWKGQGVVIRAMKELAGLSAAKKAVLVLAGDHQGREDYLRELEQLIEDLNLGDRVALVGHCADMAAAYALAHVTIIASTEPEAFGRTSAEAQAMGCPVIATNIGAPPETVRATPFVLPQDMTGWLVRPEEPKELATALKASLALSESDYKNISKNATLNVREYFSDDLMKVQTLEVYDELLGTNLAAGFGKNSGLKGDGKQLIGRSG